MSDHRCPYVGGLATCPDHPKWHVIHVADHYWLVYRPFVLKHTAYFDSWREAFDYAYTRATTEATP